jgi:uncharacterized small protein (DUF1192 family)
MARRTALRSYRYNGLRPPMKAASAGGETKMDEEELLPGRKPAPLKDLTLLGIAELEEYIAGLESEIARARAEIAEKRKHRGGAESLFKR